jgi:hypothetical protein
MAEHEDWKAAWKPMIDAVGRDFGGKPIQGADQVELGLIRRYCEPLELDCAIHYDTEAARSAGYDGIVAPVSSVLMFSIPPMWSPGDEPVFTTAGRDDQPARSPIKPPSVDVAPPTTGYFATDIEFDFLADLKVGDRLTRVGNVLLACEPKETRVGRGAFTTWQWEMRNQRGELVARVRTTMYLYNGHESVAAT